MLDPSKRFATLVLAAGVLVLLIAIAIGEHMGNGVLGEATERAQAPGQATITPEPNQTSGAYSPDWKSSQALAAAPDPHFPDPRVPPVPLPTRAPTVQPAVKPSPVRTFNPNIPIWRQTTLPSDTPSPPPAGPQVSATPNSVPT